MAGLEEVLSETSATDYIHDAIQFVIDKNLRVVPVPSTGNVLGVTGDKNVNRVNFKMDRYYDGNDLSTFTIRISYVNANGESNYYDVTDAVVEDGNILFTWLVGSDATAYAGNVRFAVRFFVLNETNGTLIDKSFNTSVITATVIQGMYVSDAITPEAQNDIIAQIISQLDLSGGSASGTTGGVGQIDDTESDDPEHPVEYHGEIFNCYEDDAEWNILKNKAIGRYSHAEGAYTTAAGDFSHAEGAAIAATGDFSHAEGCMVTASGDTSHGEGESTTASGEASHAEGGYTTAAGDFSHVEGYHTTASGKASHAEGGGTIASGAGSHAEGNATKPSGNFAHAEGSLSTASGIASHAEGIDTIAASKGQHVQGFYNVSDATSKYAMIIGNGTGPGVVESTSANTVRSNAFTVDWDGNIQCGKTNEDGTFTTWGKINGVDVTQLSSGSSSSGVGQIDDTVDSESHGEIFNSYSEEGKNKATADCSHAEGYCTEATGEYSHAEGGITKAIGSASHAEGHGTEAQGECSHAEGCETYAEGSYSHSEGNTTYASGDCSHSEGESTYAVGEAAHAEGSNTIAGSDYQHVQGKYNIEDENSIYAMIIGNGSDEARSNAFTVDWNGNIQCGKINEDGTFTTNGTINGIDIVALAERVAALEG